MLCSHFALSFPADSDSDVQINLVFETNPEDKRVYSEHGLQSFCFGSSRPSPLPSA